MLWDILTHSRVISGFKKKGKSGTFLEVQWLRLCAGGAGSIPAWEVKIPHTVGPTPLKTKAVPLLLAEASCRLLIHRFSALLLRLPLLAWAWAARTPVSLSKSLLQVGGTQGWRRNEIRGLVVAVRTSRPGRGM